MLGLGSRDHHPDRKVWTSEGAVPLDDGAMLGAVEVELEHDAVGAVERRTPGAFDERAGLVVVRAVAHHHLVAIAGQKRTLELLARAGRHIQQDRPHRGLLHGDLSLRSAVQRCALRSMVGRAEGHDRRRRTLRGQTSLRTRTTLSAPVSAAQNKVT